MSLFDFLLQTRGHKLQSINNDCVQLLLRLWGKTIAFSARVARGDPYESPFYQNRTRPDGAMPLYTTLSCLHYPALKSYDHVNLGEIIILFDGSLLSI